MTSHDRSMRFAAELLSVRDSRHFVRDVLLEWGLPELVDDAQLGTSEVVTNAVKHAGTEFVLTIRRGERVVISVEDLDRDLRRPTSGHQVDPTATSGRGLHIVAAISDDWGVRATGTGKAIWFSLRPSDAHGADDAGITSINQHRPAPAAYSPAPRTSQSAQAQAQATN